VVRDAGEEAASAEAVGPKERIFHAAMTVALRKGFGKVALSLVAHEAGLSKGGLLHHFATKNDLIRAMLEYYAATREGGPAGGSSVSAPELDPFAVALLIAAADNPALIEPFSARLRPDEPGLTSRSETTSPLVGNLVAKFNLAAPLHERRTESAAFVVRHRADETLLGLFAAQNIDALWDMVDEFSDPAEYEYLPVTSGALVVSKLEADAEVPSVAGRSRRFEYGAELSGGLMDILTAEGDWTPFHAADEGSGIIARMLDHLDELEQTRDPMACQTHKTGDG
jgi:AcrR family transcriptional regulator